MILVIGYGNETRGDDGLGPYVARRLAEKAVPGVRIVVGHQLLPEMALTVAESEHTIFLDAAASPRPFEVRTVQPCGESFGTHAGTPEGLLALTRQAFEKCPAAKVVAVGGERFDFHLGLSETARRHADEALAFLESLLTRSTLHHPVVEGSFHA